MVEKALFYIYNVQRAITPNVGQPELWFLCYSRLLMMFYICMGFHENISNGLQLTERTWVHSGNGYVQRAITPKVGKQIYGLCVLHVVSWCFTFVWSFVKILRTVSVMERARIHGRNGYVQRQITPKIGQPELQFICSARRLMVLYICVKFCENISNGIRVMEWIRNYEALTDRRTFRHLLGIFFVKKYPTVR